jgi:SAM-dependent methyltransferase
VTRDEILAERERVVAKYGPWTAHDIDLGCGASTLDKGLWQQWRVDFFAGLIRAHAKAAERPKRILDLACLEGLFTIEFARMGHETVGLEIREAHLAKAEFARRVLGLDHCRFVQGDVRAIPEELGRFDVILCAGILYHLDFPDCVWFLRVVADRATDLVVIDSHFAYDDIEKSVLPLSEIKHYALEGGAYRGREIVEHARHVTDEQKAKVHTWASIDNRRSVWLHETDVRRILEERGFALAARGFPSPSYQQQNPDRPTLVFRRR